MSLTNKYRPLAFEDVIGQKEQIDSLVRMLDKGTNVFLITGASGVGKTTIAKIAAKYLEVHESNINEFNSANTRGIDTARDISNKLRYAGDGNRVWIFDEVHSTTKDFQEAMLKPLEEKDGSDFFFLCTTDPQKLIAPLRGRCKIIALNNVPTNIVAQRLRIIAKKEGQPISVPISISIAEASNGQVRDAVALLESIIGVSEEEALKIINGIVASSVECPQAFDIAKILYKNPQWEKVSSILKELKAEKIVKPESIRIIILSYGATLLSNGSSNSLKIGSAMEWIEEPLHYPATDWSLLIKNIYSAIQEMK